MRRTERTCLLAAASIAALIHGLAAEACTISATGVAFGAYDPRAAGADNGTGSVRIDCALSTSSVNIALSAGGSGSFATRKMTSGAALLNYNLYTTAARSVVWGDGGSGTSTVTVTSGTVTGSVRRFTRNIFGRIPALQNVPAGTYSDTIMVTVTF